MSIKKVPLQDLELWPDEVICFSAYTDTRNPVQQRRTYVDGEKLKAENAELRDDLLRAQRIIGQISHEGFELIDENAKLRELLADMWRFTGAACKKYPRLFDPATQGGQMVQLNTLDSFEQRMRELRVEVFE